jgi:LysR family nitrogen assimilation transcriptional regulator
MNLKQLNILVAVAEYGSFSAAASALHTTQSNISAHISRLESELGVKLIERATGRLTKEGLVVIEKALKINSELSSISAELSALNQKKTFVLSMGIVPLVAKAFVSKLVTRFSINLPYLRISLIEGSSKELESKLLDRQITLAVMTKHVTKKALEYIDLYDEYLVLAYPKNDSQFSEVKPRFSDLPKLELVMPSAEVGYRFIIDQLLNRAGLPALKVRVELNSLNFISEIATAIEKPTIIPRSLITKEMQQLFDFYVLPELPVRHICIATSKEYAWPKELTAVVDTITSTISSQQ